MDSDYLKSIMFEDILSLRMSLVDGIQDAKNASGVRRDRTLIKLGILGFTIEAINKTGEKSLFDIKKAKTMAYYEEEDFLILGKSIMEMGKIPSVPIFWDEQ